MQDRFKFRVWDKENKCMHYPGRYNNFSNVNGGVVKIESYFTGNGVYRGKKLSHEFDDAIIMQCTGLKDKNGKLIYEGDVVKVCDVSALGYVRERIGKVVYGYSFYPAFVIETTFGDIKDFTEDIEVIGNKFENPELLDEGEACKK